MAAPLGIVPTGRWRRWLTLGIDQFSKKPALGFFILELLYLVGLLCLAVVYVRGDQFASWIRDPLDVLPVAWFGALGAVSISLKGVFDHNNAWDSRWNYWHIARPLTGAVLGTIGYLIFVTALSASTGEATEVGSGENGALIAYLIGFLVGYREETFRELIKRLTDLVLAPQGVDTEPPSIPRGLTATPIGKDVQLEWEASTDNVGVVSYNVYRDTKRVGSTGALTYDDKNLQAGTYVYSITAIDRAGNESSVSDSKDAVVQ